MKKIIYLFFFLVGAIHVYNLHWWYKTIMNDYNLFYEKFQVVFESEIRPKLVQDLSLCYRNSKIESIPCSFCEKIFQEKTQNKSLKSNITFRNKMPYSVEVRWNTQVGLIKYRFAYYELEEDFKKNCLKKTDFRPERNLIDSREDYAQLF